MKDATEIVVILDKSGSMQRLVADVLGGFETFINEQKQQSGAANLSLILFDTTYTIVHAGVPIRDVPPLTKQSYVPGGNTALLDALGRAITETGKRLSDLPEQNRPKNVIVVVMTDGQENSSQEHTREQIKAMVTIQREKYAWEFIYLGANVDAFAEAGQIGIVPSRSVNFSANPIGTRSAYGGVSSAVSSYRQHGLIGSNWKKDVK